MATQTITETCLIEKQPKEAIYQDLITETSLKKEAAYQNINNNNSETKKSNGVTTRENPQIDGKDKNGVSTTNFKKGSTKGISGTKPSNDGDTDSIGSSSSLTSSTNAYNSKNCVHQFQLTTTAWVNKYSSHLSKLFMFLALAGYTVYFGFAINYSVEMARALIVITCIVLFCIVYVFIRDHFGEAIYNKCFVPVFSPIENNWDTIQWFFYPTLVILLILYISLYLVEEYKQLQSVSGIVVFVSITYLTSSYPDRIKWRPVMWGYGMQFMMAVFVLRWETGYKLVKFLGDEITKFINYSYDGAATVYGDPWMIFHPFAFMGMSILIYMGAVMSILYYYGITQTVACKTAWLMQKTMGTTAIETLGVASNIFLNGMDTMLMLRKYLDRLTPSEFHTFLVGGHSTVAGFVFGLFILFGAPPQHLLSAAVMSAPAVIGITKLNFPETRKSITKRVEDVKLERGEETNVFEACANGAAVAGKTVAAVVTNYIAFMALLAWVNATLSWLGGRVGYGELSFELICSYLFWPIALLIGVDINECQEVAKLIGIKLFTTEILAYQELGRSARAGLLNDRSQTLATYAMCGFSSLSTLAIAVGVWQVICPQKLTEMTGQMGRSLMNANMACFMTACISGSVIVAIFYSLWGCSTNEIYLLAFSWTPWGSIRQQYQYSTTYQNLQRFRGLMYSDNLAIVDGEVPAIISWFFGIIPSYKDLVGLLPNM